MTALSPDLLDTPEGQTLDRKSTRLVTGKSANWSELARDCVAFANANGGRLLVGVEDEADAPDPTQRVGPGLVDGGRNRVGERTVNAPARAVDPDGPVSSELDEEARSRFMAEIEKVVARDLYRLTSGEMSHVLSAGPVVEQWQTERYGEYRTKRLVLDGFRALPRVDASTP